MRISDWSSDVCSSDLFFVPLSSRERPEGHVAAGWPFWLTIGLIALGAAVSFIPTPAFSQYFTPPVAFVIVLVIVTHAGLDERERRLALPLMATVVAQIGRAHV